MRTVITMAKKRASKSTEYRSVAMHREAGEILEQLADKHGLRLNQVAGHIVKWFMGAPEPLQDLALRGFSYAESLRLLRMMGSDPMIRELDDAASKQPQKPSAAQRRKPGEAG